MCRLTRSRQQSRHLPSERKKSVWGAWSQHTHRIAVILDRRIYWCPGPPPNGPGSRITCYRCLARASLAGPITRGFLAGSGKTLISIMLIKEKSKGLLRGSTFEKGRRITIFLAPKVALVWQVRLQACRPAGQAELTEPCEPLSTSIWSLISLKWKWQFHVGQNPSRRHALHAQTRLTPHRLLCVHHRSTGQPRPVLSHPLNASWRRLQDACSEPMCCNSMNSGGVEKYHVLCFASNDSSDAPAPPPQDAAMRAAACELPVSVTRMNPAVATCQFSSGVI